MERTQNNSTQKFPITKPQICTNNPRFPYRDIRHYTSPCCDFPHQKNFGAAAKETLEHHNNSSPTGFCHSPDLPTSHPWFEPS